MSQNPLPQGCLVLRVKVELILEGPLLWNDMGQVNIDEQKTWHREFLGHPLKI